MDYYEIAEELNYTGYEEQLAAANNATLSEKVKANSTIEIPPLYFEIPETAWSGSVPPVEKIIGSLYPNLPSPTIYAKPQSHKHHQNWLATVLEVAASVAIMTFAPEAIMLVCSQYLASVGAVATLTATTASVASSLGTGLAYGASGALANTASQLIGVGLDHQKFNFKSVATNAITSAISVGMGKDFGSANIFYKVATAEATAVMQQVALKLTGLERHYDWKTLETAAFNAESGNVVGDHKNVFNAVTAAGVSSFADQINSNLMYTHQVGWANVTAVSLGSMIGTYRGTRLDEMLKVQTEERRGAEGPVDQIDYDIMHSSSGKTASQYLSEMNSRQRQNRNSAAAVSKHPPMAKPEKSSARDQRRVVDQILDEVGQGERGDGYNSALPVITFEIADIKHHPKIATKPNVVVFCSMKQTLIQINDVVAFTLKLLNY